LDPTFIVYKLSATDYFVVPAWKRGSASAFTHGFFETQTSVLLEMFQTQRRDAEFVEIFPDLAAFAEGIEELTAPNLRRLIAKQAKEVEREFDVLSVKIPADALFLVGIPLIALLAFLIHAYSSELRAIQIHVTTDDNAFSQAFLRIYLNPALLFVGLLLVPFSSMAALLRRIQTEAGALALSLEVLLATGTILVLSLTLRNLRHIQVPERPREIESFSAASSDT
jgi:hypothetical protein